ncbi:hypothetical protein ACJX0J_032097, partial [Zea mays]
NDIVSKTICGCTVQIGQNLHKNGSHNKIRNEVTMYALVATQSGSSLIQELDKNKRFQAVIFFLYFGLLPIPFGRIVDLLGTQWTLEALKSNVLGIYLISFLSLASIKPSEIHS